MKKSIPSFEPNKPLQHILTPPNFQVQYIICRNADYGYRLSKNILNKIKIVSVQFFRAKVKRIFGSANVCRMIFSGRYGICHKNITYTVIYVVL